MAFRRMHNKKYEKYRVENKAIFAQSVCTLGAQTIKTAPLNAAPRQQTFSLRKCLDVRAKKAPSKARPKTAARR